MSSRIRHYQAAAWDEPVVMELGAPGRRGFVPPSPWRPAAVDALVPDGVARSRPPALPELSEYEVRQHYSHLAQQTLGMMGVSLFGTCTMKYNPPVNESMAALPGLAAVHPLQHAETMQGLLALVKGFESELCHLSGMSAFSFQPGGGADAAYLHACITRAYHASRGELGQRTQVITTAQAHPCNPATAAAAGFEIITLPLEPEGYPSLEALKSVLGPNTAALMVNNPDDLGIYNPHIKEWVDAVHEVGGLCFYDHANFNGVMTRVRAADLGFDACMFMLHKTFGVPKGGGGPAVGAYGCSEELARFLPTPAIEPDAAGALELVPRSDALGQVREHLGNLQQVVKAYSWLLAMGTEGLRTAADLSVLANNYMELRLLSVPGVSKGMAGVGEPRLEMTRFSLGDFTEETGVSATAVQNRMTDYGIDAFWMSHEPWFVPEPFTPEAGEMWSKEDIDYWIDVLAHVLDEAREDPEMVRTAPHRQAVAAIVTDGLDDPERWATTWRAYLRKHPEARAGGVPE